MLLCEITLYIYMIVLLMDEEITKPILPFRIVSCFAANLNFRDPKVKESLEEHIIILHSLPEYLQL